MLTIDISERTAEAKLHSTEIHKLIKSPNARETDYPSISMMIWAEMTLRKMLAGYTVAYATAGSSPSPEGLAKSRANGLAMLPQSMPTLSA